MSLPRWSPSQSAEKTPSSLISFSSSLTHPLESAFSCADILPGSFLQLSTPLLDGDPRLGVLRQQDRKKGREERSSCCVPQSSHTTQNNNAVSTSLCLLRRCQPDAGGRKEREQCFGFGHQCLQLPQLAHTLSLPDQTVLAFSMASGLAHHMPQSSLCTISDRYHCSMKSRQVDLLFLIRLIIN